MTVPIYIFLLIVFFHLVLLGGLFQISMVILLLLLSAVLVLVALYEQERRGLYLVVVVVVFIFALRGYKVEVCYDRALQHKGKIECSMEILQNKKLLGDESQYEIQGSIKDFKVIFYQEEPLTVGDLYEVKGFLKIPADALNTGGYSRREQLKYKGVYFQLEKYTLSKTGENKSLGYYIESYKESFLKAVAPYIKEHEGIFRSLFLGDQGSLEASEKEHWRSLGISHLLAVSGSHVSVFLTLGELLVLFLPGKKVLKRIFLLSAITLYGLIVFSPSALRCILFFLLMTVCRRWNLPIHKPLLLGIVSIVLLLINPYYIFTLSYQLSFIIMLGFYLSDSGGILKTGSKAFLLSFPLLLYYFQEASFLSIIMTPLVLPLVYIILLISGVFFYVVPLSFLLHPLGIVLDRLLNLLASWVQLLGHMPFISFQGKQPVILQLIFYYGFLWLLVTRKKKKEKVVVFLCFSLVVTSFIITLPTNNLKVHFINVGQGDAILVEIPKKRYYILIDGGKKDDYLDMGKREVVPYLQRLGIYHLNLVISTHADLDHLGGLEYVVEMMAVEKILIPSGMAKEYKSFIDECREKVSEVCRGQYMTIGDVSLEFLNPEKKGVGDSNHNSVVCSISYRGKRILLTGDCDLVTLEENIGTLFEVVKAPHHGSKASYRKDIYEDLGTSYVIFSAGANNNYGHPSEEIIEDLEISNIKYLRTDAGKEIVVEVGEEIVVK